MAERSYIQNRRKRAEAARRVRLAVKAALAVCGCALLCWLLGHAAARIMAPGRTEEETAGISLQEAGNLAWLLADTAGSPDPAGVLEVLQGLDAGDGGGDLTAGQAGEILALFRDDRSIAFADSLPSRKQARIPAADWYGWFDGALERYDVRGQIENRTLVPLGTGTGVTAGEGEALPEGHIFSTEGTYVCFSDRLLGREARFRQICAVARGEELYALRAFGEASFQWHSVWIKDAAEGQLTCFYEDHSVSIPVGAPEGKESFVLPQEPGRLREQVADLLFEDGRLAGISPKESRVSGRLLRLTQEGAEVEGQGLLPFADDLQIYRLSGSLKTLESESLRIGYAFTDFVMEDGFVTAALVPKEERMETIRVLIRDSGYGGLFHDRIQLQADCGCTLRTGPYGEQRESSLAAGETLTVTADDERFGDGDRICLQPDILTGHIFLPNVERAQERPAYRGSFELLRTEEGLVVINEVLLEEYLYAVVPSEMPPSYPLEALKSQAVCARTYAYAKMLRAGLAGYGAHLDDSVSFQVYQNLAENAQSTEAVRLTKGRTLFWEGEAAEAYYYSTSCGFGTDASVWMEGNAEKYPYLQGQEIRSRDGYYEQEEPWFRWRYEVEALDAEAMERTVVQRWQANPSNVLLQNADGDLVSGDPAGIGRILDISVAETGTGGVVKALLITGEEKSVLLKTEYNIRAVLCDGKTQVLRQDGSLASAPTILPSAFFVLETHRENGVLTGYTLSGGGFGHGVGMSQNGARRMAMAGLSAEEILDFFYRGCELRDIYDL